MTDYLITIPGDEAVWNARTPAEQQEVGEAHGRFAGALAERGHRLHAAAQLRPLAETFVLRGSPDDYAVTEGPYAESAEQVGGVYLVGTDDLDDLLRLCGELSQVEPVVELRPTYGLWGVPS